MASFSNIIISQANAIADGTISGFGQFVHDPKYLKDMVNMFNKQKIPSRFADAVVMRRIETQKLDDIWTFPLNLTCSTTTPLPWTICEATVKSKTATESYEFNLMRIVDFIGRNYVRLVLPEVDTSTVKDSYITSNPSEIMTRKDHMYLGSWQRDLIPRIIDKVEFYPRSASHKLFVYTGYDIYINNILFGNAAKQMNDLMSGEDQFELCYDPYAVHGSALGAGTYKGVDNVIDYTTTSINDYLTTVDSTATQTVGADSFVDTWIHDTYMTGAQFTNLYRKNVWYEAPVAKNYHVRHSIHSRRFIHSAKIIVFPLDILPFGYSIASSLPTASVAGDCGYISIRLKTDWFNRSFYLTKLSDIPVLYPIVNHSHYVPGDVQIPYSSSEYNTTLPTGRTLNTTLQATGALDSETGKLTYTGADAYKVGWVNPNSIGKYGRADFWNYLSGRNGSVSSDSTGVLGALNDSHTILGAQQVVNGADFSQLEGVIPTAIRPNSDSVTGTYYPGRHGMMNANSTTQAIGATNVAIGSNITSGNSSTTYSGLSMDSAELTSLLSEEINVYPPSSIDISFYNTYKDAISVKLLQVGYESLPAIRQFLSKLPNIYITTEWESSQQISPNDHTFDISNQLYIQAMMFWFIPVDSNGIENLRLYPNNLVNHEMPLIPGLELKNEQSQGTTIYDYQMLNEITPHLLGLHNPLLENMALISFSPRLAANQLPLAYYDTNISGYLRCTILAGDAADQTQTYINMKNGYVKIVSIGTNGIANVNLNLFRLIF